MERRLTGWSKYPTRNTEPNAHLSQGFCFFLDPHYQPIFRFRSYAGITPAIGI